MQFGKWSCQHPSTEKQILIQREDNYEETRVWGIENLRVEKTNPTSTELSTPSENNCVMLNSWGIGDSPTENQKNLQ